METWTGVSGKRVVLTGGTHGIGLAAAGDLARRGAQLSIVARSEERAAEAVRRINARAGGEASVDVLYADLSLQDSVRRLARDVLDRYSRIDVLVNNAGAMFSRRQVTAEGFELTWALNHLAPFLLTSLLLERLIASAPARVVTTTSDAHKNRLIPFDDLNAEGSYATRGFRRYGETKLANILFTAELARRLEGTGVTANCVHPGMVSTGFNRNNGVFMSGVMAAMRIFSRSPQKGAETLVWLTDSPDVSGVSGGYFVDKRRATPSKPAQDAAAARKLWEVSEQQTRERVPA